MTVILSMMMVLGITSSVSAQTASPATADADNATITVKNPAKGETYTIYQLFDATVDGNGNIAYQGDIPTSLSDYFEAITGADASTNYVKLKDSVDTSAGSAFWTALETWAGTAAATATATSDGSELTFNGLPYGYYVVVTSHKDSTTGKAAITVDSTNPNAEIYDKNITTVSGSKDVDDTSYSIGETITYTATFDTTNYMDSTHQVTKYVISDTLPEFLSNVKVKSITVGGTEIDTQQFDEDGTITITWAEGSKGNYTSLYANGAKIVITYTGVLTDTVNVNAANTNTVTIRPYVSDITAGDDDDDDDDDDDEQPWDESWSYDKEITTYAAALKKTDGTNALAGAKFAFYGLTVEKTADGVYTVVRYDSTAYATTDDAAQDTTKLGTEMEVDSEGKLYIVGLKAGLTLHGVETVAPDGYNKLTTEVELTPQVLETEIYKESGTRNYDTKGNLVSEASDSTTEKTVTKNLSELDENGVEVINNAGTELPSTGGIGTTLFYVIGAILAIGAGVLLVTRRRMRAE